MALKELAVRERNFPENIKSLKRISHTELVLSLLQDERFRGPKGDSVKGDKGEPGKDGESIVGPQGIPGESVRGEKGDKGEKGDSIKGDRGEIGKTPKHEWDDTKIRFQKQDGSWGKWQDLKGKDGLSIRGENGKAPEHQWDKTRIRFKNPDGSWGPYVDLKGEKGDAGENGLNGKDGKIPDHEWQGSKLRFEKPDGNWGKWTDLQGPRGVGGGGGATSSSNASENVWSRDNFTILSGETKIIDQIPVADLRHADYILNFLQTSTSKERSLKLSAVKDDTGVKDTIYAKIGSHLDIEIDSQIVGLDYQLICKNNESTSLSLSLVKMKI